MEIAYFRLERWQHLPLAKSGRLFQARISCMQPLKAELIVIPVKIFGENFRKTPMVVRRRQKRWNHS